jgi:2,3-bisphosphoglycerate-dependent phosphoglycerate mutase
MHRRLVAVGLIMLVPRIGSTRPTRGVAWPLRLAVPRAAVRMYPDLDEHGEGSVVFLRHGESEWNNANRFTGWVDVALSPKGEEQARLAGRVLAERGFTFDKVYTSFLQRTTRTAELVMSELEPGWSMANAERKDGQWTPFERSWRLNERMYGALTGLNKKEVADMYGQVQFEQWVRDPPPLQRTSPYFPGNDALYASLKSDELPLKESFEDCMRRVVPLWEEHVKPDVQFKGKRTLVISSRNAIRALLMHISDIPTKLLLSIDIPVSTRSCASAASAGRALARCAPLTTLRARVPIGCAPRPLVAEWRAVGVRAAQGLPQDDRLRDVQLWDRRAVCARHQELWCRLNVTPRQLWVINGMPRDESHPIHLVHGVVVGCRRVAGMGRLMRAQPPQVRVASPQRPGGGATPAHAPCGLQLVGGVCNCMPAIVTWNLTLRVSQTAALMNWAGSIYSMSNDTSLPAHRHNIIMSTQVINIILCVINLISNLLNTDKGDGRSGL